jgi:hypothetical protein
VVTHAGLSSQRRTTHNDGIAGDPEPSPVPTTRPGRPVGDYFAEVLLLDQATDTAEARAELGWRPSHPGLVDELRTGSYRRITASSRPNNSPPTHRS